MCVPWELNQQHFALLTQCSTTEPQEHSMTRIEYPWTKQATLLPMFHQRGGLRYSHSGQVPFWYEKTTTTLFTIQSIPIQSISLFFWLNIFLIVHLIICHISEVKWGTGTILIQKVVPRVKTAKLCFFKYEMPSFGLCNFWKITLFSGWCHHAWISLTNLGCPVLLLGGHCPSEFSSNTN